MNPAIWLPTVRTGTGTDVFTERLVAGLQKHGLRAEITWLPLRAEYLPWAVPVPKPPQWANIVHVNTWLHSRFLPPNLPIVATLHHSVHHPDVQAYKGTLRSAYHRFWIAPNERRVLRRAQCVTAVSQFVASTTKQTLLDVPMQVIYNGVDTARFSPGTRTRRPDEPFRLLYVGGWKALKGVDLLAPIMRELGDGFELRYTGGPSAINDKSRMPPNMHNIGRLHNDSEVIAAMQEADALLFPSRSEGFGLVAAEAMACEIPVVATRNSSLTELVVDGETGLLCMTNDFLAIATNIRSLADDPELHGRLGRNARKYARTQFNEEKFIQHYLNSYRKLLNQNPEPPHKEGAF